MSDRGNVKMSYKKVLVVTGGSISDEFATEWMKEYHAEYTIVADSGMEFMRRIGCMPDMIIGDFDSVKSDTLSFFKEKEGIIWEKLNPVKDDTDTEFAIRQAIVLGASEITVLGATGTRIDHVLGNVALLGIGLQENVVIQLVDAHNRIRMIDSSLCIHKDEQFGCYVSLLAYSPVVKHLTLKGFKYPLEDYNLEQFTSLGVSNEIMEEKAEILFEEGVLLVIEARD